MDHVYESRQKYLLVSIVQPAPQSYNHLNTQYVDTASLKCIPSISKIVSVQLYMCRTNKFAAATSVISIRPTPLHSVDLFLLFCVLQEIVLWRKVLPQRNSSRISRPTDSRCVSFFYCWEPNYFVCTPSIIIHCVESLSVVYSLYIVELMWMHPFKLW